MDYLSWSYLFSTYKCRPPEFTLSFKKKSTTINTDMKYRSFNKKTFVIGGLVTLSGFASNIDSYSLIQSTYAIEATKPNFKLEVGEIDTNPLPTKKPAQIKQIISNTPPTPVPTLNQFTTGHNYTVNKEQDTFSFALSQKNIDFGELTANNPIVRTLELTLKNPMQGAQVVTYEDRPLTNNEKIIIPDTTCDTGVCSEQDATEWESVFTYGFGYRCESDSKAICNNDFTTSKHYKQYPDTLRAEIPQTVITSDTDLQESKAKIYYKVNISNTQKAGSYTNAVTYLAIPSF